MGACTYCCVFKCKGCHYRSPTSTILFIILSIISLIPGGLGLGFVVVVVVVVAAAAAAAASATVVGISGAITDPMAPAFVSRPSSVVAVVPSDDLGILVFEKISIFSARSAYFPGLCTPDNIAAGGLFK